MGAAHPGGAPCCAEAARIWRKNCSTWRSDEKAAQLLPGSHGGPWQVEQPGAWRASVGHGEPVGHDLVVAPSLQNGLLVCQQEGRRIRRAIVARRYLRLELERPLHLPQGGGESPEPPGAIAGILRSSRRSGVGHGDRTERWSRQSVDRRGESFSAPPTWRAKCRITGSGKTLEVRILGCARRSLSP